jgi:dihydrofolate reductase
MEQEIVLIAAMGTNKVLGKDGKLLWHIPEDLKHFKALTTGFPIVMGRKTFDAIQRPLPNRRNIVISKSVKDLGAGVELFSSPDEVLTLLKDEKRICIVGGGEIYALFLPLATRLELTMVDLAPEGDAYFPSWDEDAWELLVNRESPALGQYPKLNYTTWVRKNA